jgi:hypothetical protein
MTSVICSIDRCSSAPRPAMDHVPDCRIEISTAANDAAVVAVAARMDDAFW